MNPPRFHLIAPAASCRPFFEPIGVGSACELIGIIQEVVGDGFRVTGNATLIEAGEDETHGGRNDDRERAADIEAALADDDVAAIVALRGGAWFTRILPLIDFSVLDRRTRRVAVFGFSELTTFVNIVGSFRQGVGVYDMGPALLTYALKRYATMRFSDDSDTQPRPGEWMLGRLRGEFDAFFADVVAMIRGKGSSRAISGHLVRGDLEGECNTSFVGGNLAVLSTLVGSPFESCVRPSGRWLVLEDLYDKPERIDRFLSHLTLARFWDECRGILLGDFHRGYQELTQAVLELLPYHVPPSRRMPILVTRQVGHIWPMSPLPLHQATTISRTNDGSFLLRWPDSTLQTV